MSAAARLEVKDVYAAYDKADVLEGVTLSVAPGSITCLLGSNGSGKTTLIRAILGLTRPRAGSIRFGDTELAGLPTHKVVAAGIACIPEGRKVFPKLTVEENLRLGAYQEDSAATVAARLAHAYEIFPRLAERRAQLAGTMSGGEQAMVSIGRGLMSAPRLLLVDEPSLGLSPLLVKENFQIIRRINEQGITVFLVEQNVHQTLAIAHHGYVLQQGRVVAAGSAEELARDAAVHQAYFG
ncbi:MAG: ABC transporter ATP-binding protein [Betaproteobacteria bacterium]|nr:ABC transporter ATP-binding protein [Betaproteobacteria bacterium]MDH5579138.1 ABC transporter ATP-binding protein [Betaproteobacteria bacterium]